MFLVISAIAAGFGMYYLQVHAFYEEIQATAVEDVQLTSLNTGLPEPILYENFKGIDADSSPLRYRACFETSTVRHRPRPASEPYTQHEKGGPQCLIF